MKKEIVYNQSQYDSITSETMRIKAELDITKLNEQELKNELNVTLKSNIIN